MNSLIRISLMLIFCLSFPTQSSAFNGQFWGAVAEQMNENDRNDNARKRNELEEQRLELERQRMQYELDRTRQQQQIEVQRRHQEYIRQQEEQRQAQERKRQAEISKEKERLSGFTGTGFFVSNQGHIITNAHVVGDHKYLIAKNNKDQLFRLDVLATERNTDLALLQADTKSEGLALIDPASVQKGMKVYAIGYPQTSIQGSESKITDGIISSMTGLQNDSGWYQISVPIQAGNSGGPLVSENGSVVGVVVATVNVKTFLTLTGDIPQNINFGIKVGILENFLARNGLKPLREKTKFKNPLKTADDNTLLIASRPVPFDVQANGSPSELRSPPKTVTAQQNPTRQAELASSPFPKTANSCASSSDCTGQMICTQGRCQNKYPEKFPTPPTDLLRWPSPILGVKKTPEEELEGDWTSAPGKQKTFYDAKSISKVGNNVFVRIKEPSGYWIYVYHYDIDCVGPKHRTTRINSYGQHPEDFDEKTDIEKWRPHVSAVKQVLVDFVCSKFN